MPLAADVLDLPSDWLERVYWLKTPFQVNNFFETVLEDLSRRPPNSTISTPFDMEWSVNRANGIHGRVALLQLIYENSIYLIPVCFISYFSFSLLIFIIYLVEKLS